MSGIGKPGAQAEPVRRIGGHAEKGGQRRRDAGVQDVIADADSRLVLTPAGDDVYNVFVGGVSELNVTVYSLQGSPVTTVSAPADEVTVDLSALAPGVYILSANNLTRKITVR